MELRVKFVQPGEFEPLKFKLEQLLWGTKSKAYNGYWGENRMEEKWWWVDARFYLKHKGK